MRPESTLIEIIDGTAQVSQKLTGVRSAKQNTDEMLANNYPVDIYAQLAEIDPTDTAQVTDVVDQLADTTGVSNAEPLYPVATTDEPWAEDGQVMSADLAQVQEISAGIDDADVQALDRKSTRLNS